MSAAQDGREYQAAIAAALRAEREERDALRAQLTDAWEAVRIRDETINETVKRLRGERDALRAQVEEDKRLWQSTEQSYDALEKDSDALRAQVETLREALRPFADLLRVSFPDIDRYSSGELIAINVEMVRRARAALAEKGLQT